MGSRHRAREFAVQILFQLDVAGDEPEAVLPHFWEDRRASPAQRGFAERLVRGTWEHRASLDQVLEESATHWKVARMAAVDRNVLRLALFELLHGEATPAAVVLDEAIELAKRFGNADSGPFVNGVLDAVRQRLARGALRRGDPALEGAAPRSRSS